MTRRVRPVPSLPPIGLPPLATALRDEVSDLLDVPTTLGIAVFGSVARGDYGPASDIELQVIDSAVDGHETRSFLRGGVFIHEHLAARVDIEQRRLERFRVRPPFADAWVVIDRDGQLTRLREVDREIAAAGRPPLSDEESADLRRSLTSSLMDLEKRFVQDENGGEDEDAAAILCHEAVRKALSAFYSKARRWEAGPKRVLGDLEAFAPDLAPTVRRALRSGPGQPVEAVAVLGRVLRDLGGRWSFVEK
ncbi:MAG: nucleotidyltransferase domain-containing protein [Bacillota bacterium]